MQLLNKHENQNGRGLTFDLWKNFPADEILIRKDSNVGIGCQLDVGASPYAAASSTNIVAGSGARAFTDATSSISGLTQAQYAGGAGMRMLASADNDAAELQLGGGGEPFIISDTAADVKELVLECHFRVNSVTANDGAFFIGLASAQTLDGDLIADNGAAPADVDLVGLFHAHADTTGVDMVYQKAGGGLITHETDFATIAADTWYVFGMRYLPQTKKIDLYWGTGDRTTMAISKDANPIVSTDIDDATFPDGEGLCPTFVIKGGHADDKTLDIRTFAAAQVAYPTD